MRFSPEGPRNKGHRLCRCLDTFMSLKYALMYEIKSVKERDRFAPAHNQSSEELEHWYEEHKEMAEDWSKKWASFSPTDTGAHEEYTDYIKLA